MSIQEGMPRNQKCESINWKETREHSRRGKSETAIGLTAKSGTVETTIA
jgi:hypothetical protein